ncbi:MAG: ATP-binding cassette domain-containing protein [Candidatus Omnitrophica bacterium]|nr:ATP-binding cassette domain-containing protein [Candidatus Omnitrophota bacterium]
MIEIKALTKSFNGQKVLDGVDLTIAKGEILVVLGQSGTGKSVLLKHIIGLLKPDSGSVKLNGTDISQLTERELLAVRKKVGFLFQDGALYDFMTVFENVAFPLVEHTKLSVQQVTEKVIATLESLDLHEVGNKLPSELSGGMRKRVALARAIILDTDILLCDEPTSGLDPLRSRDISDVIYKISRKLGCSTVIASHDITNSFRIGDRLALLNDGKVAAMGSAEQFRKSEDHFVKEFMLR